MIKQKYKSLLSNTLVFALGSFGSKLISFFLVPLYTYVLTTDQFGTADFVVTCSNILVPIVSFVIQDAVFRFSISKNIEAGSVLKNSFVVLALGSVATVCLFPLIELYPTLAEWTWYLIAITITNMFYNVMLSYAKSIEKTRLYAIVSIINTLVLAGTNILFLVVFDFGVKGYLLANIVAQGVSVLVLLIFTHALRTCCSSSYDSVLMKQMLLFSLPLIVNNLSWWVLNYSSRVLIEIYYSTDELGIFTAASKIPALLSIFTTIFIQAWNISAAKEYDEDRDNTFFANIFNAFQMVMFVGGSIIVLITKPFMGFYVGDAFFEAWKYVPLLLLGIVYYSFSSFYGAIYGAVRKNASVAMTTFVAAGINFVVNFLLLPRIGIWAAALANAVSYFAIAMFRMFDSRKFYKIKVNFFKFAASTIIFSVQVVVVSLDKYIYLASIATIVLLLAIYIKDIAILLKGIKSLCKSCLKKSKNEEGV